MSRQALDRFYEVVRDNPSLQDKLKNSPDLKAFTDMVVKLGSQNGCVFTASEVAEQLAANTQAESSDRELSDQELEVASGGLSLASSYWCGACGKTSATGSLPV